jgi:hypothetical protein
MRARAAASILAIVAATCTRAPAREPPVRPFSVHLLPPSPSPLRIEVQAGGVRARIPDGWEVRPLPDSRYPQEGFVASPQLAAWERHTWLVGGMEAFWIDVTKVGLPSDYYYLVARGPAVASLAASKRCHRIEERVVANHPPDFTGRRFSPGDYVISASGTCQAGSHPARWAYIVAAPGFGPARAVGLPRSGLYVVIAVVRGKRAEVLLRQMLEAARFGQTPISDIVRAAQGTT